MNKLLKHQRIELEDGKSLTVGTHSVWLNHPLHWHSFFEIEIILSGEGKYVVNDVEYDISDTNVFLLTSTDYHYLKLDGGAELINISFDETMIADAEMTALVFNRVKKAYKFEREEYDRLVSVAKILEHECESEGDCRRELLAYIIKSLIRKNTDMSHDGTESSLSGIRRAIIFMELHFREDISLERVATEAGYTPAYFSRLFKRATGKSYVEALTKHRLGYARTLLANGFSVADACFSSGFGSLTGFQETFRKKHGISPSEYKKRCRSQDEVN